MPNFTQSHHDHHDSDVSPENRTASMMVLLAISFVIGFCLSTVAWGEVLLPSADSDHQDDFTLPALKSQVEDAIGLPVATIQATFERPQEGEVSIPWRNQMVPVIRIALPQQWVSNRASIQGSQFIVLEEVKHIALLAVPSARVELHVVPQTQVFAESNDELPILGKHFVVLAGLITMFLATYVISRRKSNIETVSYNPIFDVTSEANRILQLDYVHARQAIDSLYGHRKQEVLHHIASSEEELMPIIEVSTQKQHATV